MHHFQCIFQIFFQSRSTFNFIGYFSKEHEQNHESYNLSCIVVAPNYLRQGYGDFLIDLSYMISKFECRTGAPEKPFSKLGAVSYFSFWRKRILLMIKKLSKSGKIVENITISGNSCFTLVFIFVQILI